jgi:GntR family transcriptional regulator, transcriptional repressor for pyruvate dehydrogenase complex
VATVRAGFEAVRKTKLYEGVTRQIERLISEGSLKPGDKLPSERELAEMFQVSRTSLRDGIRHLELLGLLEARHGKGTIVRDVSADSLVNPLASMLVRKRQLVAELLDVRKMLEPPLAARAATNASPEEIVDLENILRRQGAKVRRGELAIEEDSEFHYNIARAAKNSVVMKVLDVLIDLLRKTRERSLQVGGRLRRSFAGHRQILRAIQRRDASAAETAMRHHLEEIEEIVLKKME